MDPQDKFISMVCARRFCWDVAFSGAVFVLCGENYLLKSPGIM